MSIKPVFLALSKRRAMTWRQSSQNHQTHVNGRIVGLSIELDLSKWQLKMRCGVKTVSILLNTIFANLDYWHMPKMLLAYAIIWA
ncbi:TPA: hypothetical protein NJ301_001589 [Vibrio parahaemolyticus]|nr:hypothetical protein [Vibrio parahaemolyticus]